MGIKNFKRFMMSKFTATDFESVTLQSDGPLPDFDDAVTDAATDADADTNTATDATADTNAATADANADADVDDRSARNFPKEAVERGIAEFVSRRKRGGADIVGGL